VPKPELQRANVADVILQVSGREGVAELVQEPPMAVRTISAAVLVRSDAISAVESGAMRNLLQLVLVLLVRFMICRRED